MTRDCARRYHDPQLVALADQYGVTTELWALPWLFTIFASGVPISIVLHIWDLLLLSIDSAAPLYFACALVICFSLPSWRLQSCSNVLLP